MELNINTDAVVRYTNMLEKMHRSALPSAVRGTLNKAVFDIKTNTMPKSADETFVKRAPNFFKANSKFEKAVGFDVDSMKAMVGFVDNNLKGGGNNYAVKDLEQQEYGGTIDKKSFIPIQSARVANSNNKPVRANARLAKIRKLVDARKVSGKNNKQKFVHAVSEAGVGGFVLSELNGQSILWRVNSLKRTADGKFKLTALYLFKEGRSVRVNNTNFMKKASLKSASSLDDFFIAEAQRQIDKLRK